MSSIFHSRMVVALTVLTVGLFLYAPTISLLLFWDDVPHTLWLDGQRNGAYWLSSEGFPFYRPATFAVWDFLHGLIGRHDAPALHTLSVSLHLANSLLVVVLAARLSGRLRTGFIAGLIFVSFPYNYQAVIPTAAQFHLLQACGLLMAAWLQIEWMEKRGWVRLALSWLIAFAAIFNHENGILAPALIGFILLANQMKTRPFLLTGQTRRRLFFAIMPVILVAGFYGVMWSTIPKGNDAARFHAAALDTKIAQTAQGLSFPLAALAHYLFDPDDPVLTAMLGGGVVLFAFVIWLVWQAKAAHSKRLMRFALLALVWIPVVMLPAWFFLDVTYLLGSPRLHYLASIGIAWLWGAFLTQPTPSRYSLWVVNGALLISLGVAVFFVRERVEEHQRLDSLYREAGAISYGLGGDITGSPRLLVVNLPAYFAPRDSIFLLGSEGSTYMPDFINPRDLLRLNGFDRRGDLLTDNRLASDIVPNMPFIFNVSAPVLDRAAIRYYDAVALVQKIDGTLHTVTVGRQMSELSSESIPSDFGNGIVLHSSETKRQKMWLELSLVWEVRGPVAPNAVFVHLLCEGQIFSQADGAPVGRLYPFDLWQAGEIWRDTRYLPLPPCDDAVVFLGVYDPNTGNRYRLLDGSDGVFVPVKK